MSVSSCFSQFAHFLCTGVKKQLCMTMSVCVLVCVEAVTQRLVIDMVSALILRT